MVSLKNKFGVCFFICAIVLASLPIPAELVFSADFSVIDTGGAQKLTPCALNIFPGDTQNKYTASGCSYTTQTRTCCSNGTWSNWDEECKGCEEKSPCSSDADCCNGRSCVSSGGHVSLGDSGKRCGIQCSESSKPTCKLSFGTCRYFCTCDISTGKWENCQKSQRCNPGYESVDGLNGDICCQKSDGTGPRCAGGPIAATGGWVDTNSYVYCNGFQQSSCGECRDNGSECRIYANLPEDRGKSIDDSRCRLYICRK